MSIRTNIQPAFRLSDLNRWGDTIQTRIRGPLLAVLTLLVMLIGVGGYWAATAPLGGAVVTAGRIIAKGRNIAVQNLEGGILESIQVREGDKVVKGQLIAQLDTVPQTSQLQRELINTSLQQIALERWRALEKGQEFVFDVEKLGTTANNPRVQEALTSQLAEARSYLKAMEQKLSVIDSRRSNEQQDINYQRESLVELDQQAKLISEERSNVQKLRDKGLVPNNRLLSLDRELSRLEAARSEALAKIEKATNNRYSLDEEAKQVASESALQINQNITALQSELSAADDRIARLQDTIGRSRIVAPADGTIFQVPVQYVGAVIKPGQIIAEILPAGTQLEVETGVLAKDVAKVDLGQTAEIVFPTDQIESVPPLAGEVVYVAPDSLVDEKAGTNYYVVRLGLDENWHGRSVLPGMGVQVFLQTEAKTLFELVTDPLLRAAKKAFED